jgi:hypothetical protein
MPNVVALFIDPDGTCAHIAIDPAELPGVAALGQMLDASKVTFVAVLAGELYP